MRALPLCPIPSASFQRLSICCFLKPNLHTFLFPSLVEPRRVLTIAAVGGETYRFGDIPDFWLGT